MADSASGGRRTAASPFEQLAPTYDVDFTASPIARHLRARVHARLERLIALGEAALELGCGTGEDALMLARRGVHITATDTSEAMLTAARSKLAGYGNARVAPLDIGTPYSVLLAQLSALCQPNPAPSTEHPVPSSWNPDRITQNQPPSTEHRVLSTEHPVPSTVTLVFANFGVLNCLPDWRPLAQALAELLPVGGRAAFGVMGPLCLWEIGWHALHGEWGVAFRRLKRGGAPFSVLSAQYSVLSAEDSALSAEHSEPSTEYRAPSTEYQAPSTEHRVPSTIHYPSPKRLARAFAPEFRVLHLEPLGLFLPPSDIYGVLERRPRLLRLLTALDDRVGRVRGLAALADHYWIELERVEKEPERGK